MSYAPKTSIYLICTVLEVMKRLFKKIIEKIWNLCAPKVDQGFGTISTDCFCDLYIWNNDKLQFLEIRNIN